MARLAALSTQDTADTGRLFLAGWPGARQPGVKDTERLAMAFEEGEPKPGQEP